MTVTEPNSEAYHVKNAGREILLCFCQVNLRETVSGNRALECEIKKLILKC